MLFVKVPIDVPPGIYVLPSIEYAGCFWLLIFGDIGLYLPGPGVLERSSAKLPMLGRLAMEYEALASLLGILLPISGGRKYVLGEGVVSPVEYIVSNRLTLTTAIYTE